MERQGSPVTAIAFSKKELQVTPQLFPPPPPQGPTERNKTSLRNCFFRARL